jgi:hypothetical protein
MLTHQEREHINAFTSSEEKTAKKTCYKHIFHKSFQSKVERMQRFIWFLTFWNLVEEFRYLILIVDAAL